MVDGAMFFGLRERSLWLVGLPWLYLVSPVSMAPELGRSDGPVSLSNEI
jgi:hypothetical protein